MLPRLGLDTLVITLKAAGESTRLRILSLLAKGDLTVSDLTEILGQSQPRVSRHLKLLHEAGLIDRYQEGAWAFFRLADSDGPQALVHGLLDWLDPTDRQVARDGERLGEVKKRRQQRAADYFAASAAQWDELRSLHAADGKVEAALRAIVGPRPFHAMLDLGTGTGRMLELFAGQFHRGVGVDMSREMLEVARVNLDRAGIANASVRQGDLYAAPVEHNGFDLVTMHQVLHYLDDPSAAIAEAARFLRPAGRLVIIDFAQHEMEFLREHHQHQRLGFSDEQIAGAFAAAGLEPAEPVAIAPEKAGGLTVKIWLARDPRILVAEETAETETA
jgi:ArsR family transcriptional regulator